VDLYRLADWLVQCGIDTVALESTGVYWIPVFEILGARSIAVQVVNARHVKTVPGRKSNWNDAQWLQQLHALGLLRGSFRPDAKIRRLRTYLRHRADLLQHRAPHILHMQKALMHMNIQLTQVLTDITGVTGLAIIRAIVAGERNPVTLAQLRNAACKSSQEQIAKALTGTWCEEHLFVLHQALALFDFYRGWWRSATNNSSDNLLLSSHGSSRASPSCWLLRSRGRRARTSPTLMHELR
jgi:hypothetical protein